MLRSLLSFPVLITLAVVAVASDSDPKWTARSWQGRQYEIISPQRVPTNPDGKVEVIEFFWYGCPHCFDLEPFVLKWDRSKEKGVRLIRVAVGWDVPERVTHAKIYYVLRTLNRTDLHGAVFDAIHKDGNQLFVPRNEQATLSLLKTFAVAHGIDGEKFVTMFKSPEASQYVENANQLAISLHVTEVPTVTVDRRYKSTAIKAGGGAQLFQLVDFLVREEHSLGKSAGAPHTAENR